MKKYISIIFAAAVTAFTMTSCNKEGVSDIQSASEKSFVFTATQEPVTKTALDGLNVIWSVGDKVRLFFKKQDETTGKVDAACSKVDHDGTATFEANIPEDAILDEMYAVYKPNDSGDPFVVKDDGKNINSNRVKFQKVQTAVLNGFDPAAAPMAAHYEKSEGGAKPSFYFRNLASFVKLTISGAVSVKFENGNLKTGSYYWGLRQEGEGEKAYYSLSTADNPQEGVTLNAPDGGVLNGTYYIAVPPFKTTSELSLTFTSEGGDTKTLSNTAAFEIIRGQIINLGTFHPFGKQFGVDKIGIQEVASDLTYFVFNVTGDVAWTATADNGAAISPASGSGAEQVTVTIPENTSSEARDYVVTVTTEDTDIPESGRTKSFTIRQAGKVVGVMFGHKWATTNYNAVKAAYTADNTTSQFEVNMMTVTYTPGSNSIAANESSKGGYYLRGNALKVTFMAGEAGDAMLSFRVRIAKPSAGKTRSIYVKKNDVQVTKITHSDDSADLWESYEVPVNDVEVGDVILIDCSGSGNNGIFMNDANPISWNRKSEAN